MERQKKIIIFIVVVVVVVTVMDVTLEKHELDAWIDGRQSEQGSTIHFSLLLSTHCSSGFLAQPSLNCPGPI